jgi:hypothetical protein
MTVLLKVVWSPCWLFAHHTGFETVMRRAAASAPANPEMTWANREMA